MGTARLTIESIAGGGDGVGRVDGLAVFVPRSAPGDVVEVVLQTKGRFARGRLVQILHPSDERTTPPCTYYTRDGCGGCQIQHLRYEAQLRAKQRIVRDAFERVGKRRIATPEIRPSPHPWRYRRKLTLTLRRQGGVWAAGLHAFDDPDRLVVIEDCPITDERVVAAWREVMAAASHLPRARELRGAVRLVADGPVFVLEGGASWPHARELAAAAPSLVALWWVPEGATRRLLVDRRRAPAPDASFAQVNPDVAAELRAHVVARTMAYAPRVVVDAYAGAGEIARLLAHRGAIVTAIERDHEAADWAARHLTPPSRAVTASVEDALPAALPADVVILNPQRAGVDARVAATLAAAEPPPAIIYVSCDPATLARDAARLSGYRVAAVTSFDMFPQTAHVETVCELVPERA